MRPSEGAKATHAALKARSLEQVMRHLTGPQKHIWIVQKAVKVTALGISRGLPHRGLGPNEVEMKATLLSSGKNLSMVWTPKPLGYFPPSFPLRGYQLFELVGVTRRLSAQWGHPAEVEWALAGGKMFVLDARQFRGGRS